LYGTNSVGKTSLIRALGITIILAQAGFYVPATEFEYYPYKALFTRILGNDNLFKGLSSFAVEMGELRTILKMANESSLILGDELCSGTESISAMSIFLAGIQTLYQKKCSFVFATHLHEIVGTKELEEMMQRKEVVLKHMSVIWDREKKKLIYDRKIKNGSGDNMYGLEVCNSLQLPDDFLEKAIQIRKTYFPITENPIPFVSPLSKNLSHFSRKKVMGICESCKQKWGTEVHHKHRQSTADKDGFIHTDRYVFHKNHPANLQTLCHSCHQKEHH
jgi:DNA mismatch repair protein MutS